MFSWSNSRTPLPSEQGGVNLTLTALGPFMTIHLVNAGSGASPGLAQDNESARAVPCRHGQRTGLNATQGPGEDSCP